MLERSPSAIEKRLTVTSLASVCFALFAIATFHLPLDLQSSEDAEPRQISTITEYVTARGADLGLTFSGRQAQKYVLGAQVYMDLALCKTAHLPTHITHLQALTPVQRNSRGAVWELACQRALTQGVAISLKLIQNAAIGFDRNRAAPSSSGATAPCDASIQHEAQNPAADNTAGVDHNTEAPLDVFLSSQSDRWFTPGTIISSSRRVLKSIDLDPFSEVLANLVVRAQKIYTRKDNGYKLELFGRVFMNPPGGMYNGVSGNGYAFERLLNAYKAGKVQAFIAVLKAAVGYKWFNLIDECVYCRLFEGQSFTSPIKETNAKSPHGYVVVYGGADVVLFAQEFSQWGRIIVPSTLFHLIPAFQTVSVALV
ncbi:hypothetical protein CYMTET_31314 [Cymbomonas tetramitiformis]|uniref:Uncharacterized protein n=1 Tax=Cymbomonas tetramitiformis TaxID=36881 RepID=A0AAE0FI62_9CHLO|nr:hypothetical protein CYMTET_31314 [Cymbomonas tetramitiformis]